MKWRIVTDQLFGFRAQCKPWAWWPFWSDYVGEGSVVGRTVEEVEKGIAETEKLFKWKRKVVKEI